MYFDFMKNDVLFYLYSFILLFGKTFWLIRIASKIMPEPMLNRTMSASRFQIKTLTRITVGMSRLFIAAMVPTF